MGQQDIVQTILPQLNQLILNRQTEQHDAVINAHSDNENEQKEEEAKPIQKTNENEIEHVIFESLMLQIMRRNLYPCDDEDTVLQAFKCIQKHYQAQNANQEEKILYENDIVNAIKEVGGDYCLDSRELDEFLNIAIITTNKKNKKINDKLENEEANNEIIYYEDYVAELFYELQVMLDLIVCRLFI